MATMQELYQQYLLTQPGIGGSQNRYRELMSQARPFVNPYPAGTGLLAGGTVAPVVPRVPAKTNPMGTYTGESSGGGGTGGGGGGGTGGPNVSFDANGNIVGNNVNSNVVGGVGGLLGLAIGLPGLGFIARELANRYNFTNDQAAMFANVGLRDTTDPANLTGLIGRTATIGPTGTGGQAQRAGAAAAEDARAMGFTDAAIAAAAQAAANATIDGKTAEEATAAARSAAFAVAQNIDDDFAFDENITSGLIGSGSKSLGDPRSFQAAQQAFTQSQIDAAAQAEQAEAQAESARQAAQESFRSSEITEMNNAAAAQAAAKAANATNVPTQEEVQNAFIQSLLSNAYGYQQQIEAVQQTASDAAAQQAASDNAAQAAIGSYGGGSFAEQDAINAALAAAAAQNDSPGGGVFGGSGYDGGMFSGAQSGDVGFSKGGKVIKNRLKGPDPKGPDDGAGLLQIGEFVIKKSAVNKYGEGLLGMINDGKIPAKKMKSLLG